MEASAATRARQRRGATPRQKLLGRLMVWHRWLALPSCLFFGIWFVSGMIMMYARMPTLTEADRLARLPELNLSTLVRQPAQVALAHPPERVVLGMQLGRPVYRVLPAAGAWSMIDAGERPRPGSADRQSAIRAVEEFLGRRDALLSIDRLLPVVDQWTVYPASKPFLPFYVVRGNDQADTTYYVSASTGSVYLVTTRRTRLLAWLGAIPHWWYLTALRSRNSLWHFVMIAASGWGVLMTLFGFAAGVLRFSPSQRYRFPGPRYAAVPHVGIKRWHYLLGYGFGVVTFTWILSGLFSMNPGSWSPGPGPSAEEVHAFAGAPLDLARFTVPPQQAWSVLSRCVQVKEMELVMFDGDPFYLARQGTAAVALVPGAAPSSTCLDSVPRDRLIAAGRRTTSGASVASVDVLYRYDSYYYDREGEKPLPMVRLRLLDAQRTWLYLNPRTAAIQARYTNRSRWERWLYNGLHCLDFPFLFVRRPLWDIVVLVLSLGGLALSVSGIVLSVRYLRRRLGHGSKPGSRPFNTRHALPSLSGDHNVST